jgi:hypothetical protein
MVNMENPDGGSGEVTCAAQVGISIVDMLRDGTSTIEMGSAR